MLDLLIKGTTLINGQGEPASHGDLGVRDARIAQIGRIDEPAGTVIDGSGLVVCPGFIDGHTHADLSILEAPGAENFLMQGITSVVGGHCGIGTAPVVDRDFFQTYMTALHVTVREEWSTFDDWLRVVEAARPAVNYVPLAGLNALRGAILGRNYQRASTAEEIARIRAELETALDAGAFGLSSSFDAGTAGHFADETEVLTLLDLVVRRNVLFAPHTRHHQYQWPSDRDTETAYGLYVGPKAEILTGRYHGMLEILEYARQREGLRVMLSHISPLYNIPQPHPDYLDEAMVRATLETVIDQPRARGIDITFNTLASDHSVGSELPMGKSFFVASLARPEWLVDLDFQGFAVKLQSRKFRNDLKVYINSGRFKFGMLSPAVDPYWSDCYRIIRCANEDYVGKTIFELAWRRRPHCLTQVLYDEAIEVIFDILVECPETTWALLCDKRGAGTWPKFLKHPFGMPCSDTVAFPSDPKGKGDILDFGVPPSAYNTMPYYLIQMVRRTRMLSLEQAIQRITTLPADVLGLRDRGKLQEGYWADLVVMDWDGLKVHDDFTTPHRKPDGIQCVIVNGKIAYQNGAFSAERNGDVLRKGQG